MIYIYIYIYYIYYICVIIFYSTVVMSRFFICNDCQKNGTTVMLPAPVISLNLETPPRLMPEEFITSFTMNGSIPLADFFVDDTMGGKGSHYKFSRKDIDFMINSARKLHANSKHTGHSDAWLLLALAQLPIQNVTGIISIITI